MHKVDKYTVDVPGTIEGTTPADLTDTTSWTVNYEGPSTITVPESKTQTVNLTRTADYDNVTKVTTYSDWTITGANFDKVDSPEVVGYAPDVKTVAAVTIDTKSKAKIDDFTPTTVTYTAVEHDFTFTPVLTDGTPVPNTTPTPTTGTSDEDVPTDTLPKVPGYTPKTPDTPYKVPTGDNLNIVYTPNAQSTTVAFVDDDAQGVTVGTPQTIAGVTDGTAPWSATVPDNYKLVDEKTPLSGTIHFSAEGAPKVVIHLQHIATRHDIPTDPTAAEFGNTHDDVTQTINFSGASAAIPSEVQVAKFSRDYTVDEVTKAVTYGNWTIDAAPIVSADKTQAHFDSRLVTLSGYSVSVDGKAFAGTKVGGAVVAAEATDVVINVVYTGENSSLIVNYVDESAPTTIVKSAVITGNVGDKVNFTPRIPTGYDLVKVGYVPTLMGRGDQGVTVTLKHIVETTTVVQTYTITVIPGPDMPDNLVSANTSVEVTWTIAHDLVTGIYTATPNKNVPAAHFATIHDGDKTYVPNTRTVATVNLGVSTGKDDPTAALGKRVNTDVTYQTAIVGDGVQYQEQVPDTSPSATVYPIEYVDGDGDVIGTGTFTGNPGDNVPTDNVPDGYHPVDGNPTIQDGDTTVIIKVKEDPKPETDGGKPGTDNGKPGTKPETDNGKPETKPGTRPGIPVTDGGSITPPITTTTDGGSGDGDGTNGTNGSATSTRRRNGTVITSGSSEKANSQLPQTGDDASQSASILGAGLLGLAGLFGFAKKRKKDEE